MGLINSAVDIINFMDGNTAFAEEVNKNYQRIIEEINGKLDDSNIKAGANISGSKIAPKSITANQLANAVITSIMLAANSVAAEHIQAGAVRKENINNDIVGSGLQRNVDLTLSAKTDNLTLTLAGQDIKIKDAGVDTAQLKDAAVTPLKLNNSVIGPGLKRDSATHAITFNTDHNSALTIDPAGIVRVEADETRGLITGGNAIGIWLDPSGGLEFNAGGALKVKYGYDIIITDPPTELPVV